MNETQYYSATANGETRVGVLTNRVFIYLHELAYSTSLPEGHYTDPTPVKFVPQDAVVMPNGVTLKEVTDRLRQHLNYMPGTERHFESESWIKSLIARLTPPKPRPEEPKAFGSLINAFIEMADNNGFRCKWTYGTNGSWYSERGFYRSYSDLRNIEILFDAGQVK